jgi:dipeptidyl aminopeptidase/acylaminoacyl peptidase
MRISRVVRLAAAALPALAPLPALARQTAVASPPTPTSAPAVRANALKQLDSADLAGWKSIRVPTLSPDGRWFVYQLAPNEGDAEVVVRSTADSTERRFPIGEPVAAPFNPFNPFATPGSAPVAVSGDSRWLAFTKYPTAKDAKRLRRERRPLQNSVVVVNLATGERREFDKVRRFAFNGERPAWIALHRYVDTPAPSGGGAGAPGGGGGAGGAAPRPADAADLLLVELATGVVAHVGDVGDFGFDRSGEWLAWTVDTRDRIGNGVQLRNMRTGTVRAIDAERSGALYRRLTWDDSLPALAVLRGRPDSAASDTAYAVVGFTSLAAASATRTVYEPGDSTALPAGMRVSPDRSPRWSEDLSALIFGIAERRPPKPADARPAERPDVRAVAGAPGAIGFGGAPSTEDELPSLVLWHWKDPRLQSQQQVQEGIDKSFSHLVAWRPAERRLIRAGDDSLRSVALAPRDRFAVASDVRPYERSANIDGRNYRDLYVVDLRTGEKRLAVKQNRYTQWFSPDGEKFLYYDDGHFHVYDMTTGSARNITADVPTSFINTEDDHNIEKPAIFPFGWSRDGRFVLLYDNWDVWKVPVQRGSAVNLSRTGKTDSVRFLRRMVFDPRERGIDLSKPLYFAVYGEWTKKEGVARIDPARGGATRLIWDDAKYFATRARDAEVYLFTRQTVREFPDYWVTNASFAAPRRITDANPQQKDYAWSAGSRIVEYTTEKGDRLQGALHLPANYEPGKRYPTVVYIYEKRSQFLHSYSVPNETQAFNPSVYTSRGYAVFQPDIVYRVNDPGMSAVWSVVPAVKAAIATGIVDSANVGLHGHSWGGYQTAFLVTQTNIFKSAIAGAALTDMVSMYSSVYWNTGGANMAIFESSQGRFKGNFIDNYDAYIRNSPAYHANKVETPLLLLHNERDGAVDFNQGITFYNTLRQLGKEVVLLQYVGENHGLQQPRNQKDYTSRMREYFDHHLKGAPAPDWLTDGVPRLRMEEHLKSRQKKEKIAS